MNHKNDSIRRNAFEEDRALQADPELTLGGERASISQIALTVAASFAIIALVMYGLNHQRDETAATEPAQTTAQAPEQQASPPATAQTKPGDDAQKQQNASKPNAPQGETTGSGTTATPGSPATGRADSNQQGAPTQANAPKQTK